MNEETSETQGAEASPRARLLVAGNYCHDTLVSKAQVHRTLGGSAAYIGAVLQALGEPARVIAKVGGDFLYAAQVPAAPIVIASARTTSFVDDYRGGERQETLEAVCEPIFARDVQAAGAGGARISIAAAVAGEVLPETLRHLRAHSDLLLADAQGLLRTFGPGGAVGLQRLEETPFAQLSGSLDYLKVSRGESRYLDVMELSRQTTVLLTDGAAGCTLIRGGVETRIPAFAAEERDATGAGDCFLAGFALGLLHGLRPEAAARVACWCGARAVEQVGVPRLSLSEFQRELAQASHSRPG